MAVVASQRLGKNHRYLVKTNALCSVLATYDMPTKVNMGMGLDFAAIQTGSDFEISYPSKRPGGNAPALQSGALWSTVASDNS